MDNAEFRSIREALGLSLAKFANALQSDPRSIARWGASEEEPSGRPIPGPIRALLPLAVNCPDCCAKLRANALKK